MKTKYEFRGWDWTELLQLFPDLSEEYDQTADESVVAEKLENIIACYSWNHAEDEVKELIGHLREFL